MLRNNGIKHTRLNTNGVVLCSFLHGRTKGLPYHAHTFFLCYVFVQHPFPGFLILAVKRVNTRDGSGKTKLCNGGTAHERLMRREVNYAKV